MTLSRLIEQAVIADLSRDSRIAEFPIQYRDNPAAKAAGDTPFVITVSANEGQEVFGTGIKKMAVSVELRASLSVDPTVGTLLDEIESAVSARLQPSYPVAGVTGRENVFSSTKHKVFGITADGVTRTESNLERVRVVNRTFIATLLP